MSWTRLKPVLVILLCFVAVSWSVVPRTWPMPATVAQAATAQPTTLSDLQGLDQLRTRFNHDTGVPRLILLLSPT